MEFALHVFLLCAGAVYCSAEQIAECPSGGLKQFSREIRNYLAGTVVFHHVGSQTNCEGSLPAVPTEPCRKIPSGIISTEVCTVSYSDQDEGLS